MQEVRSDKCGPEPADNNAFFCGSGKADYHFRTVFLYARESYKQLRGQSLLVTGRAA